MNLKDCEKKDNVERGLTKALFGSQIRPEIFEPLIKGEITVSDLAKQLEVPVATLLTCIAPLLPYRIVTMSLGPEKSIALGYGIPADSERQELIAELAKDVMKTKETIRKLSHIIAKNEERY